MLKMMKKLSNFTCTENGAATFETSGSYCLDLFAAIGALRSESDQGIIDRFMRAYTEDADLAMKILFYARDVRGGLGERHVFRTILAWLAENEPASVRKNISYIAEFGRFDDLLSLLDTSCEEEAILLLKKQLDRDLKILDDKNTPNEKCSISLLGKWLPSINASNAHTVRMARRLARAWKMSDVEYRHTVVRLRKEIHILENNLREKDYTFDYEKQPSRALHKYRKAFQRNDEARYRAYIADVLEGKRTLNAGNIAPYELVEPYLTANWGIGKTSMRSISEEERDTLNAAWASLPDFGGDENMLAIVDTSGSMYCQCKPMPAAVALSLGLYFAEHNRGAFHNCFIEFSERPRLIEIKGKTFADRLRYVSSFNEIADTNLEAVFDLILKAAVRKRAKQEELPEKLVIISDMEFNRCVRNASSTNFENAKQKFEARGYKLPAVIFWNVASRNLQQPVTMNEAGVMLISGATPRIFRMVVGGQTLTPYEFMLDVLRNERYAAIAA